jgi:hypothetical protein
LQGQRRRHQHHQQRIAAEPEFRRSQISRSILNSDKAWKA